MQRRVSVAIIVTVLGASNGALMSIAISAGRENAIRTAIRRLYGEGFIGWLIDGIALLAKPQTNSQWALKMARQWTQRMDTSSTGV